MAAVSTLSPQLSVRGLAFLGQQPNLSSRHGSSFSGPAFCTKASEWVEQQGRQHFRVVQVRAASAEEQPAWKKKLELADQHAEATRAATAAAKAEYEKRQAAARRGGRSATPVTPLAELPLVTFLNEEGKVADVSQADAKASVYAVLDEEKKVRYVGISRGISQSLRLHFARVPLECWYVTVQHIKAPSRSALEGIRDAWIQELGYRPTGNDNGPEQNKWENPLDVLPLMTEEERQLVEEAAPGPPKAKAMKEVARRVEKELKASYETRKSTEYLRFDPKLKEKGLLDVKNPAPAPDTKVPTGKPKPKAKQAVKA